jgi:hypothetical protein
MSQLVKDAVSCIDQYKLRLRPDAVEDRPDDDPTTQAYYLYGFKSGLQFALGEGDLYGEACRNLAVMALANIEELQGETGQDLSHLVDKVRSIMQRIKDVAC